MKLIEKNIIVVVTGWFLCESSYHLWISISFVDNWQKLHGDSLLDINFRGFRWYTIADEPQIKLFKSKLNLYVCMQNWSKPRNQVSMHENICISSIHTTFANHENWWNCRGLHV